MCKIVYVKPPECNACYYEGRRRTDIQPGTLNTPLNVVGREFFGWRSSWASLCPAHAERLGVHTSVTERRVLPAPAPCTCREQDPRGFGPDPDCPQDGKLR